MRLPRRLRREVLRRCRRRHPKAVLFNVLGGVGACASRQPLGRTVYLRPDAPYPCAPRAHTPAAAGFGLTSDKVRSVDGGEPSLRPSLQPPLWKLVGASISPSAVRRQALNKGREKPKASQGAAAGRVDPAPLAARSGHSSTRSCGRSGQPPQSSSNQAWARRARKARAAPTPTPSCPLEPCSSRGNGACVLGSAMPSSGANAPMKLRGSACKLE